MTETNAFLPRVFHFFKLRTDFILFVLSLILLLAFIYGVKWEERIVQEDFVQLFELELVELSVPAASEPQEKIETPNESIQDIQIEEEMAEEEIEEVKEEEVLEEEEPVNSFGDLSLNFDIAQIAAFTAPEIITPAPEYPAALQEAGVEGTILLKIGIDEDGNVVYGVIEQHVHPILDNLILDWIQTVKFIPAMDASGTPVPVTMFFPARFYLT